MTEPKSYLLQSYGTGSADDPCEISASDFLELKRCQDSIDAMYQVELSFGFVISNYLEIERFFAERLVLDLVDRSGKYGESKKTELGFAVVFGNWLASIKSWNDLTARQLKKLCGDGSIGKAFKTAERKLRRDCFAHKLVYHLRNYYQHHGFLVLDQKAEISPIEKGGDVVFTRNYELNYDNYREFFESKEEPNRQARNSFGKCLESYNNGRPFDLKPIIREEIGALSDLMDKVRDKVRRLLESKHERLLQILERNISEDLVYGTFNNFLAYPVTEDDRTSRDEMLTISVDALFRINSLQEENSNAKLGSLRRRLTSSA